MKINHKPEVQPETLTLEQQIRQIAESAPSRAELAAATEKMEALRAKCTEADKTFRDLAVTFDQQASKKTSASKAAELLTTGKIAKRVTRDDLLSASELLQVATDAVQMQTREVRRLQHQVSVEVGGALPSLQQAAVTRIITAYAQLESAADEVARIVNAVRAAGVTLSGIRDLEVGLLVNPALFHNWRETRRKEGYNVER